MTLKNNDTHVDSNIVINDSANVLIGLISGFLGIISFAFLYISSKLVGIYYEPNQLTLISSVYGGILSLILGMCVSGKTKSSW